MLSKTALVTNVDSIIPVNTLFQMMENEYCLDRVELWEFLKHCPGLSSEDRKTLLLLFFLTKNRNDDSNELDGRILQIWEEIDRRMNLSSRKKTKTLGQLVKELPQLWRNPCRKLMRLGAKDTDETGYIAKGPQKLKTRNNGSHRINIYRLDQCFTYVKVTSKASKHPGEVLAFIMDTGASVNVIKADVINPKLVIVMKEKVQLVGIIRNEMVEGLGTCNIPLYYKDKRIIVEFHVINQAKSLPFDGVLGRSFFQDHLVSVDYAKQDLFLKCDDCYIPFYNQMATFSEPCLIKGDSDRLVEAMVKNTNISKGYVPQCELNRGLFLSRAIVKVDTNATVTVQVRNIGSFERVVEPFSMELQTVPKFIEKDWPLVEAAMKSPEYKEIEAKFKDFNEAIERNDRFPPMTVQEFNVQNHSPNALFAPMNIDKVHFHSKIVDTVYRANPIKPPGLHNLTKMVSERMTTYLCTDRYLYIEQPSTKDTFITLYNLKEQLVSENFVGEFFILELNRIRAETPRAKLFKMIHYVFEETEIIPVVVMRRIRTPKSDSERIKVIGQNHIGTKGKHCGYVRTYNKVRDGYVWCHMKEDVMDYMLKCHTCKYNLKQFKALHKVLPLKTVPKKEPILEFHVAEAPAEAVAPAPIINVVPAIAAVGEEAADPVPAAVEVPPPVLAPDPEPDPVPAPHAEPDPDPAPAAGEDEDEDEDEDDIEDEAEGAFPELE